jgi:hypothetical protein
MKAVLSHRPSPALVVACIALGVALGGTSYAAIKLPAGSVGTKQLKKNAVTSPKLKKNAVTSPKVKNNALTGADVLESSLAPVPSAAIATNATNAANATNASHATNADHATNATSATNAVTANAAFSTYHDALIPMPTMSGTIATLSIPAAGNYIVSAKLTAFNLSGTPSTDPRCSLEGGSGPSDVVEFDVDGAAVDDQEVVALHIATHLAAPGSVLLKCLDFGTGDVRAQWTRVTAIQVAQLTNTPF